MPNGCSEIHGDVIIRGKINYDLLDNILQNVTIIYGCIEIKNTNLDMLAFLSNLEIINCSAETSSLKNIVHIGGNEDLVEVSWIKLTTIIGPGEIIIDPDNNYYFCLHTVEMAFFYPHAQYRMRDFFSCELPLEMYDNCKYQPPEMYPKPICPVQNGLMLVGESIIDGEEMDTIRQTRVITGQLVVDDTYLESMDGLENLEVVLICREYTAISLYENKHLKNITFPSLKRIVHGKLPTIRITYSLGFDKHDFCSRHSIEFYDCENYTLQNITCEEAIEYVPYPDGGYRNQYLFWSSLLGYPPLLLAIAIRIRTFSIILFGNVRQILDHQYIYLFLFDVINLLDLLDKAIIFQDVQYQVMAPVSQLFSSLLNNSVLHILTKCLYLLKQNSYYLLPCAFITAIIELIFRKWYKLASICSLTLVFVAAGLFIYVATPVYNGLLVITTGMQFDSVASSQLVYGLVPGEEYFEDLSVRGIEAVSIDIFNLVDYYKRYTDGFGFTDLQQYTEWAVLGLGAIYQISLCIYCYFKKKHYLFHLLLPICLLIEYGLLRFDRVRFWIKEEFFHNDCKRTKNHKENYMPCSIPYYIEHFHSMLIQRSFFPLSLVAALIIWRITWYLHCIGYTKKVVEARRMKELARKEDKSAFSLSASAHVSGSKGKKSSGAGSNHPQQ